jgi:hypothetical protein
MRERGRTQTEHPFRAAAYSLSLVALSDEVGKEAGVNTGVNICPDYWKLAGVRLLYVNRRADWVPD